MNVRHRQGVLHSFSIKNVFLWYNGLKASLFSCDDMHSRSVALSLQQQVRTIYSGNCHRRKIVYSIAQKMKFSIKDSSVNVDFVTFTEEIFNGKLHFWWSTGSVIPQKFPFLTADLKLNSVWVWSNSNNTNKE